MSDKYFTGLNYTLGNEDTGLEVSLVDQFKSKSIFSVCGSGGRSLPLTAEHVQFLTLSDLSIEQLNLAMLREATYRQLSYEDFLTFWGYFPKPPNESQLERELLFKKLDLSDEVRDFFSKIFTEINFSSVLYLGKWERTFLVLAKINRFILGKNYDRILKFDNLDDQLKYYQKDFPQNRWRLVLFLLGNKSMFNALLYKGNFIEKNINESHFQFYSKAFHRLFTTDLAQKSFFLHLCFYGEVKSALGVPVEASRTTHQRISESHTRINYINEDLVTHLRNGSSKYDFLSLSDVPSYFTGELERDFMQFIKPSLVNGAIIVNRYYLRIPDCNLDGFKDITDQCIDLIKNEKVQMYTIRIYQFNP